MQELRSAQVEHELGEERELFRHAESARIVFLELSETSCELDKHAINPSDYIHSLLLQAHVDGVASDDHGSRLLVKPVGHVAQVLSRRHYLLHCGHSQALLAVDVLVGRLELHVDLFLLFQVLGAADVEVEGEGFVSIDATQIPLVRLSNTDLCR